MKQNIVHIGLDVEDTQYHGAAFNKETGEVIEFKSRPTSRDASYTLRVTLRRCVFGQHCSFRAHPSQSF